MAESSARPATAATEVASPPVHAPARARDATSDGLVGLYALRILDRGVDPRALVAEHRAIRYGATDRARSRPAVTVGTPPVRAVGRGAVTSSPGVSAPAPRAARGPAPSLRPARLRRLGVPSLASLGLGTPAVVGRGPRRLAAAGIAFAAMLGFGVMSVFAQEQPSPTSILIRPTQSLEFAAMPSGVNPDAILTASTAD